MPLPILHCTKVWLYGKLLVEKVIRHALTISPWEYNLAETATPQSTA